MWLVKKSITNMLAKHHTMLALYYKPDKPGV